MGETGVFDIPIVTKVVSGLFRIIILDLQRLKLSKSGFQMPYNLWCVT